MKKTLCLIAALAVSSAALAQTVPPGTRAKPAADQPVGFSLTAEEAVGILNFINMTPLPHDDNTTAFVEELKGFFRTKEQAAQALVRGDGVKGLVQPGKTEPAPFMPPPLPVPPRQPSVATPPVPPPIAPPVPLPK